jgi:hypothetical protein
MSQYYFKDNVFVTSLSGVESGEAKGQAKISHDVDLVFSPAFQEVLFRYLDSLKDSDAELFEFFERRLPDLKADVLFLIKQLLVSTRKEIAVATPRFAKALGDEGLPFFKLVEGLFQYWLHIDRFAYQEDPEKKGLFGLKPKMLFVRKAVFRIYYVLKEHITGEAITLETDYSVGFVAGFAVRKLMIPYPSEYCYLNNIPFVSSADLNLPYATETKRNKRIGVYEESSENLAANLSLDPSEWFCLPLYAGESLVYLYFNFRYASCLVGALNLFQKADLASCEGKKPDILIVYGGDKGSTTGTYTIDRKNDLMVGYVSKTDEADYFGYLKKLILTLHNLRMIKKEALPIHGSMVDIIMKSGKEFRVVIMGDSGAGKSESIEAFRKLAKAYLKDIKVIFDDMGTLFDENGKVYARGTEIGAFVRLDDLDVGYVYSHLSLAAMYNLGETNARIVFPCTPYKEIMKKWEVDIFLYADNYEDDDEGIRFFPKGKMIEICEEGKRKAKGTTGEVGLVSSYFANPFGPVQCEKETHELVNKFFDLMEKGGTKLGVIYTKLGIEGKAKTGPEAAAKKLFDWINASSD